MSTLKKFFIYFLMFAIFFIISNILENGLVLNMYGNIRGETANNDEMSIEVSDAKATKVNGYMDFKITNYSNENISDSYARLNLIDKTGLIAGTEYITITELEAGETKNYKVKFKGNDIESYKIDFVSEVPDKSNVINILGWEFDATNFLGFDLTNVYGINIAKYISPQGIIHLFKNRWHYALSIANSIPIWGYVIASLIVLWYL